MGILDPPSSSTTSSPSHLSARSTLSRQPSSSSTPPTPPPPSTDYVPPTRTSRQSCYIARDAFFDCLDVHSIIDPIKHQDQASIACGAQDEEFMKECAMSWVTYFKARRVMEWNKKVTLERVQREGGREVDMRNPPGSPQAGR